METQKGLRVFEQIPISEQARNLMLGVLLGDSNRKIASPEVGERMIFGHINQTIEQ